jgi:hypothetical protein
VNASAMNAARLAPRKPVYRCLNAPRVPRTQLRHLSQAETEALLGRSSKSGKLPTARDYVSVHREQAMRRAAYVKRRNWLAAGALISMTIPLIIMRIWPMPPPKTDGQEKTKEEKGSRGVLDLVSPRPTQADSPRGATEAFQGKKVVVGAGDKILAAPETAENPSAADVDTIELVETGTSYVPYFPRTISLPTSSSGPEDVPTEAEYTLLGLGIRKVSFLRVQVYVVGLYVKTSSLSVLQNNLINTVNPTASALIPGEKDELRNSLLDPEKSSQIWEDILAKDGTQAVDMAWRVVPVRGTDFKHLQDGWMRGITSRTDEVRRKQAEMLRQQAAESKQIALPKPVDENEFSDESFGLAMKDFKQLFQGRGKAPKGSVILLTRDKSGVLGAMYQPIINTNKGEKMGEVTPLGEVRDERVSRLVWLMYLGGSNVSSEDARKNIVDGCVGIVERPVGTVEGMVQ